MGEAPHCLLPHERGAFLLKDPPVLTACLQPSGQWSPGSRQPDTPVWTPVCGGEAKGHPFPQLRYWHDPSLGPTLKSFKFLC